MPRLCPLIPFMRREGEIHDGVCPRVGPQYFVCIRIVHDFCWIFSRAGLPGDTAQDSLKMLRLRVPHPAKSGTRGDSILLSHKINTPLTFAAQYDAIDKT